MLISVQKYKNSFFIYILLILLFIIGLKIHSGYGIGGDEPTSRQNGAITINYLTDLINNNTNANFFIDDPELLSFKTPLNDYFDRDYGIVFDSPVFLIERLLKLENSSEFYNLRKISTFIFFLIGLLSIYKITFLCYKNYLLSIISVLLLLTSPRIFGESFYNSKDIVFMSLFTLGIYKILIFYKYPSFKTVLLASLVSALSTDVRIVAIILPFISLFLQLFNLYKNKYSFSTFLYLNCLYIFLYILFVFIFWPWLWENPIERFSEAFINMSKFTRLIRWELFQGQFYPTTNLPKSYLLKWIFITTPPFYILLFIFGLFALSTNLLNTNSIKSISDNSIFYFLFLSIFLSFILLTIIKNPVLYNGWRHFYFIYPFFILISIKGIDFIFNIGKRLKIIKLLSISFLSMTLLMNTYHIYRFYPLEYIYFNYFAANDWNKKYPMDYSGLSGALGLKKILSLCDKNEISVSAIGPLSINLHKSLLLLTPHEKKRILLTDIANKPDFLLTDYQSFDPNDFESRFEPVLGYFKIFDFIINGNSVFSLFRKSN